MSNIKSKRIASLIVRELSDIFYNDVQDEYIKNITIIDAKVTNDLSFARIYFTCADNVDRDFLLQELSKASSYLRTELAHRLDLRSMPEIKFIYDESLEYGEHIDELIESIHQK